MKYLAKILLLAGLATLLAIPAQADVRPPVEVRITDHPELIEPGQPFKGRLEIAAEGGLDLSNFRFEGDNWRQKSLDAPSSLYMVKGDKTEFDFEVEPLPGAGLVDFVYDVNGVTYRQSLDLSAEHYQRMHTPGAVTSSPDPVDAPGAPQGPAPVIPPEFEVPKDTLVDEEDRPDQVAKRTIRVRGRFTYQRSDGTTIGAYGVWVRVYDSDTFFDDQLASVQTDWNGNFDVNINTNDAGETNPDLYINFEANNNTCETEDVTWGNNYSWQTGTYDNYSGSDLNIGSIWPSDEGQHPALHIHTDITRTWAWANTREGYSAPKVHANWPNGSTGAWYSGEIHISTGRQWREDTHIHEWGHHFVEHYAVPVSPDYCNGICDNNGCGHCIWCQETDHDAFAEGWPNWLADIITRSFAGDYGVAPMNFRSQENLAQCTAGVFDDPNLTEGFLGALCRDIEDSGQDSHTAAFPGFTDALALGSNEIFDVVDFDHPTTPAAFLTAFKNRFPQHKENLWETAKNCGYEIDTAIPGAVTNLSSSHATTGDSPDPTVYYSWTTASDDASGIDGYSIRIASNVALPNASKNIEDVNSYTTGTLAPGTYYFSIRAVDRAGRWSSSYRWYGPVTIRAAEPADLTNAPHAVWDYPVVMRNDNTATTGSVTVSPTLDGNASTSYWNTRGRNAGESATSGGFYSRLYVDDVYTRSWYWNAIGANSSFYGINGGPFTVRGGRHTAEVRYDATDLVAETDENNNKWARQYIWTSLPLAPNVEVTRTTPPDMDGGWDGIVDGSAKWFNCDGLKASSPGWWNAVVVRALSNSNDYDVRLHVASTGSENGFAGNLGHGSRAAGCIDAVLYNRNLTGSTTYEAGVLNFSSGSGSYVAEHVTSIQMSLGDSTMYNFAANEFLMLREFNVFADSGFVSITVDIDPDDGPVYAAWLDETFQTGDLLDYDAFSVSNASGRARLDIPHINSGYNCLVVYRDPKDGSAAMDVTIEVQRTPPDFQPFHIAGWYAPVVPRPADDGTPTTVAFPDTLHGNIASTYLNFAVKNVSPTGVPSTLLNRAYFDGSYNAWFTWTFFPANYLGVFNWGNARTVRGGRHTVDIKTDPLNEWEEIHETNNVYGEQYCWSPFSLSTGGVATRSMPPNRLGGWDDIRSGEPRWFNCDGLRMPQRTNWWQAVAVMPGAGSDVDVRIHPLLEGAKNGFGTNMAYSGWGVESSDFVLVNYNMASSTGYDVGVLNLSGNASYRAHHEGNTSLSVVPGLTTTFTVPSGEILNLHEVYFPAPTTFAVHLHEVSGNVDWGFSLMPADMEFMGKSSALASAWSEPAGGTEQLNSVTIPASGYYCLAVWKAKQNDLNTAGSYRFAIGNSVSDAPDSDLPAVTALRSVYPNPFNPMTTIAFDLARPERTELAIYDLQGALVRTLRSEVVPAGSHEVVWNGTDDRGQRVASGVYMARLKAGDIHQMKKLLLVK